MKTTLAIFALLAAFTFASCTSDVMNDETVITKTTKAKISDREQQLIADFSALIDKSIEVEQKTTSLDNRAGRATAEEEYKAVRQEILNFMDKNKEQISTMGNEAAKEFKVLIEKAPWSRK